MPCDTLCFSQRSMKILPAAWRFAWLKHTLNGWKRDPKGRQNEENGFVAMKGFRGDEAWGGGEVPHQRRGRSQFANIFISIARRLPGLSLLAIPLQCPFRPWLHVHVHFWCPVFCGHWHTTNTHTYTVKTGIPKTQTQGQNQNTEDSSERSRVPLGSHVPGKANPSIAEGGWKVYGSLIWSPCRQAGTQNVTWRDDLCMQRVFGQQSPVLSPHTHTHTYIFVIPFGWLSTGSGPFKLRSADRDPWETPSRLSLVHKPRAETVSAFYFVCWS